MSGLLDLLQPPPRDPRLTEDRTKDNMLLQLLRWMKSVPQFEYNDYHRKIMDPRTKPIDPADTLARDAGLQDIPPQPTQYVARAPSYRQAELEEEVPLRLQRTDIPVEEPWQALARDEEVGQAVGNRYTERQRARQDEAQRKMSEENDRTIRRLLKQRPDLRTPELMAIYFPNGI